MITEPNTNAPKGSADSRYEYLQVRAMVENNTKVDMVIAGSDLTWGKWIQSPVNTFAGKPSLFASQGRDSSASGTKGWAVWKIGEASIKVTFECQPNSKNKQSITCTPPLFKVSCTGTSGDRNTIVYSVEPA